MSGESEEEDSVELLPVERINVEALDKVTDSKKIHVAAARLIGSSDGKEFTLDAAVAMRKGPTDSIAIVKAMGEDAFVLDSVRIEENGIFYTIPIAATLDGGGGHAFAQYGRKHLKNQFQEKLQQLVDSGQPLTAETIATAMNQTDQTLFGRDLSQVSNAEIFYGSAYRSMKEDHSEAARKIAEKLNIETPPEDFHEQIRNWLGNNNQPAQLGTVCRLNPMEIYENEDILIEKKRFQLQYNGSVWEIDLSDEEIAKEVQEIYELALGSEMRIEVQLVMNAFFMNENEEVECVTFSRGDSAAYIASESQTEALANSRQSNLKTCCSSVVLTSEDRILSASDGFHEVTSLNDIETVNKSPGLVKKTSEEYVETMMQASIINGSLDDKTIVSLKLEQGKF